MSPPAYLATRGAVGLTNLVQMAFAENVHGMELPDPVMRGIFNTCMPIIFKDLPYGMDFAKFRRSWRFYLIWVLTNFATCDGEINGNGQFLMVHTRSPWWKSVGSRYERHGLAAMRHDDVDARHRASRRRWPHAVVTRRAQGSSGHRLCHSSVTRTMHRSAPHFAPVTRIPLRATLQTSTTGS